MFGMVLMTRPQAILTVIEPYPWGREKTAGGHLDDFTMRLVAPQSKLNQKKGPAPCQPFQSGGETIQRSARTNSTILTRIADPASPRSRSDSRDVPVAHARSNLCDRSQPSLVLPFTKMPSTPY